MDQIKVLAVTAAENTSRLEQLLECGVINRMMTLCPLRENAEKAASLPVDAVVILSERLGAAECEFLEDLYMSRNRIAFILLCEFADPDMLCRAMQYGVTKVITLSKSPAEIQSGIIEEAERTRSRRENARIREYKSKIISICSTKGGSGKTTIAVNLAVALQQAGNQVVLIDLDLQFGDVGVFMNIPMCDTISDLSGETKLSPGIIKSFLYKHESGVSVLCAPPSPELAETVKPAHIEKLATSLRPEFDYVIFDLAPTLDDNIMTALDQSDTVYFVTNPEIPTLKNTRTCLNILGTLGYTDKLRLILNREGDQYVSKKDVQRSLDMEPCLCVPLEQKIASASINRGIPAVTAAPRSKLSKSIISFAGTM